GGRVATGRLEIGRGRWVKSRKCRRGNGHSSALGSGCGVWCRGFDRKERSAESAGICPGSAGDGSRGELGMATASKMTKVKVPTLSRQERETRAGHPRVADASNGARARVSAPHEPGRFGVYGGRYVPETLMAALEELEREYDKAKRDKKFQARLDLLLKTYAGRPTPLFFARRLSEKLGGAKIYLKREDLLHTGAHKINNCLGQGLLVERMGKHRVIAETGAGQHGVATATVCALLGFECVVYMGTEDMRRQELNVFRMRLLGAEVRGVSSGSRTLKDAINEAMRDWVTNVRT